MKPITRRYTLVFIKKSNEVLLGHKKRGLGKNFWAGYGGKVEKHDGNVRKSAKRELSEESMLEIEEHDFHYLGDIVANQHNEKRIVHIFTVTLRDDSEIEPEETEEMRPGWFRFDEIPYGEMFEDHREWFPMVLNEQYFHVEFALNDDNKMENVRIQVLPNQPDLH